MNRRAVSTFLLLLCVSATALSGGIKRYPGAKADDKATKVAMTMVGLMASEGVQLKATVYMTTDSFEKVVQFYAPLGKQITEGEGEKMPESKLPSGQVIRETYLVFDGAPDIDSSTSWIKIQRPYVGAYGDMDGKQFAEDVRDVTAITIVEKK
jgi:hypothetical protein